MNESRISRKGLHQIGLDGIFHQRCHGARGIQIAGINGFFIIGKTDKNMSKPAFEVFKIGGKAKNGHHFRRRSDIESRFARHTISGATEPNHDVAQAAVVHIHHPFPADRSRIEPEVARFALNIVVDEGSEQVVGFFNCRKITRKMQVDILHGYHLAISATCRPTLHAKNGSQRGFPQGECGMGTDFVERITESDRYRGLALPRRRGGHRRYEYELSF